MKTKSNKSGNNIEIVIDDMDEVFAFFIRKVMNTVSGQLKANPSPDGHIMSISKRAVVDTALVFMRAQFNDYKASSLAGLRTELEARIKRIEKEVSHKMDAKFETFRKDKQKLAKLLDEVKN